MHKLKTTEANGTKDKQQETRAYRVITVREVSEMLRLPISTIYALARKNKIRGLKFGKHWRFVKEDIENYLRGSWTPSGNPVLLIERRKYARLKAQIPAALTLLIDDGRGIEENGSIRNISGNGILFAPASGLECGDPIKIVFKLRGQGELQVQVEGRVVHRFNGDISSAGIKFRNLTKEDQEAIEDYVG